MDNLNKFTIIAIRLLAIYFILSAVGYWIHIAIFIILASFGIPGGNGPLPYLLSSVADFLIGTILYARSRSLADAFIKAVEND
jgi:hypothetical protein